MLALHDVRPQTIRHYSIASLSRLIDVRHRMVANFEKLVERRCSARVVGPPPPEVLGLAPFAETLSDMASQQHERTGGKLAPGRTRMSQWWSGLTLLSEMVNGDLRSGQWTNYCWDSSTGNACCDNKDEAMEKTTLAFVKAMFGQADRIPAESRWAHLLRATCARRCCGQSPTASVSIASIVRTWVQTRGKIDVDADAVGGFAEKARADRSWRTKEYYSDDENISQLGIFACLIKIDDSLLLYTMLGDDNDGYASLGESCKLDALWGERTSHRRVRPSDARDVARLEGWREDASTLVHTRLPRRTYARP